jgi:hypothetical protein
MNRIAKFAGKTLAFLLGIYLLWHIAYPWTPVWYRLTYEVETPEGIKTGSGIQLAYDWNEPTGLGGGGSGDGGEAIAVDLGARGVMFGLLVDRTEDGKPGNTTFVITLNHIYKRVKGDWPRGVQNLRPMTGVVELLPQEIPFLVRFTDINDPKTVEAVDPQDLSARFGAGVRLKRVTVELLSFGIWPLYLFGIPGAIVTTGIEKRLGWLSVYPEPNLDPGGPKVGGPIATAPLNRLLHHGDFRRRN